MAPAATVLVPTHNHGKLLGPAVESALAQTVADIEIFIVGDGPTEETVETARRLERTDGRVRFFLNPKGERHGEVFRHVALQEAKAPIVCYLSDDDLWFPEHVAYVSSLLDGHDFAHTLPVRVMVDGTLEIYPGNLAWDRWRRFVLEEGNFIPLHAAAHTMDFYRRLPHGWRPGPADVWSDVYMWRQMLSVPGCKAVSGTRPTTLHLTSSLRGEVGLDERFAELRAWAAQVRSPDGRDGIRQQVLDAAARQLAEAVNRERALGLELAGVSRRGARKLDATLDREQAEADRAEGRPVRLSAKRRRRRRLLRLQLLGPLLRTVGRVRWRRGGR